MAAYNDPAVVIKANRKTVGTITHAQLSEILSIYPDEPLTDRAFFQKATKNLSLTINEIRAECDVLNIPWQMFLLKPAKLSQTIDQINEKRNAKFSKRLIANRDGNGRGISLRIADRVIALQEYAKGNISNQNNYCGSLVKVPQARRSTYIVDYFEIDRSKLRGRAKTLVLDYLIEKFEAKNIRVAQGVLSNKVIPNAKEITMTYRKSSGFIVHDEYVPYVFLPSEVSEVDETAGRQILTLISLITLVGLNEFNCYINGDLEAHFQAKTILRVAFEIASEILLPISVTQALRGTIITARLRDELAVEYMLTPSAVAVTLWKRGLIDNEEKLRELLDAAPTVTPRAPFPRNAKMETSVRKFCGKTTSTELLRDIRTGVINSIPAQYLLFGHVDKRHFAALKSEIGL